MGTATGQSCISASITLRVLWQHKNDGGQPVFTCTRCDHAFKGHTGHETAMSSAQGTALVESLSHSLSQVLTALSLDQGLGTRAVMLHEAVEGDNE